METDATDVEHGVELRLKQAQAMLDLFEGDRQQAAATLEELREWASAQDQEHLQFRVDHYLQFESEARRMGCRVRPASRNIPPVLESCTGSALVPDRDVAAFALEAEIATIIKENGVGSGHVSNIAHQHGRHSWWRRLVGLKKAV